MYGIVTVELQAILKQNLHGQEYATKTQQKKNTETTKRPRALPAVVLPNKSSSDIGTTFDVVDV